MQSYDLGGYSRIDRHELVARLSELEGDPWHESEELDDDAYGNIAQLILLVERLQVTRWAGRNVTWSKAEYQDIYRLAGLTADIDPVRLETGPKAGEPWEAFGKIILEFDKKLLGLP